MFINSYKNINIKKYKKIILPRFIYSFKNINIKKYNFSKILSVLLNYAYDILTFYKKINFKNYKYFLIYAPLIILFITIGYLNIPLFFNYDKSNISNKICKTLNIECVIEDKIGYSFFPSPRININNFILKDPKNKNKILGKIENVIIVLPIDKLHSNKEFNFKKIKLQNPEINLNVKKIKNYLKYFNGGLNQKNIKINNGKINIFDGSKILSSIDNTDLTYKTGDKENQVNLRGNFLGDKIILKMKNVKDKPDIKKIASIKLVNSNIFSELIITNYQTEKKFGGNFLVKNERNRATAIFDYNEGILSVKKANLTNAFFEGKVDGLIKFSPFFDFDLTMDLNSFNFNKLYNFLNASDESFKKNLFKVNKKLNGKLKFSADKIFSKYTFIESWESKIKFVNGNIIFEKLLLDLGKLGAIDVIGSIQNDSKYSTLKFEKNLFIDNLRRFYNKFGVYNKEKEPLHVFVSGNFDLINLKLSLHEVFDGDKLNREDIDYIEREFNSILSEDGYVTLLSFKKFKEFVKSITVDTGQSN
tara:strand:- start:13156 stop:14751 length:1596 start_codon:yes stop_codon:yes gene_type:complete